MQRNDIKLMLFTGPAGSGKNSLIDVYCKTHFIEVVRYEDTFESKFYDFEMDNGMRKDFSYPDDLTQLIDFINCNVDKSTNTIARPTFSSFLSNKGKNISSLPKPDVVI